MDGSIWAAVHVDYGESPHVARGWETGRGNEK